MLTILSNLMFRITRGRPVETEPTDWADRFRPRQLIADCPADRPFNPLRDLRW